MEDGRTVMSQSRRLAAILAADIAGYSALMGSDEARTVSDLKGHQAVVLPMVGEFGGRVIDTAGDGILAEFPSVLNAVECAVAIQRKMVERNTAIEPERRMEFRIGINLGDVIYDNDRIFGDGVNVAARLEGIAEPGSICVSGKVHEEIRAKIGLPYEDLGDKQLKNIAEPVRVYGIRLDRAPRRTVLALPDKPSIAVLPFQNMSGDPEQEYFSDGMTEDLITDLSKVSGLFVIARNSSFAYKGRSVKVQEIGRDLGVRFVLEGSVRKAGNRVRITAQLIDAGSGGHLWAERFDRDLTDIFSTQDEVVEKIVGVLAVTLTQGEEQRLRRRGTGNVEAYESWLRARELLTRGTRESVAQARAMYRRAIEIDLNFAAPHAGLALAAISDYVSGWAPDPAQALDEAERWARRAVELNDQEPVSHMALGAVLLWRRDHEGALAEFRRMIGARSQLCSGLYRDRTGADVCRPGGRGAGADRDGDAPGPPLSVHGAALPGAGEFQPGKIRDRRPAARRPHRTHPRHRRQPHASGILLRPSRARGGRAGGMGGAPQSESGLLADAARARPAIQGCP